MRRKRKRLKPDSSRPAGHGIRAPVLAIVGRPNVGKSCLFNRLIGRTVSIVEPTAGVTRDRIAAMLEIDEDRFVELVDTGGLGGSSDTLAQDVDRQIDIALNYADHVLLLVDGRAGVTPLDQTIARRITKLNKPVVLCVNKCETYTLEENAVEFWELGVGEPFALSAAQGIGCEELLERLSAAIPKQDVDLPPLDNENRDMRIAIVGRRNTGKSTYVNALFGEERVIVSDMPGTTRDSVDVRVTLGDTSFTLIDTAGLRRRGRVDDAIEFIAHVRAREAIARSDVVLLFLEAAVKVSLVDKQLARLISDEFKACVLVGTKWDLVGGAMGLGDYSDYLAKHIPNLRHSPAVLLSSLGAVNVKGPIKTAKALYEQSCMRVSTSKVNKAIRDAYDKKRPRVRRNVLPRIYFATQIRTNPITLILFVNKPSLFGHGYRRYLAKQLREVLPFKEVPIKFIFRERVNIFEGGLHNRIRRMKSLDDHRYLTHQGVEEEPVDSKENVEELFNVLFGQQVEDPDAVLSDMLKVAEENPEIFTEEDQLMPDNYEDKGENVYIEVAEESEEKESPVENHPMGPKSTDGDS
ncbi:MAG: ribosome biogenesis GTPase Der [Planctomycetota bacterium]|nr:ribosome biogenesis GTPase Der [Planctomycetota bacterium]